MRLLIFDFDGVLADTLADMLRFAQEACDELGIEHSVVPRDLSDLEVMSFASFGRACEVPERSVGEFVRRCLSKFERKESPPEIFPKLPDVIRQLSEGNILVVVTGNTTSTVNAFLAHHGIRDCFSAVYGVDLPGTKAEKIIMAKRKFESKDTSTFLVGDSLSDIRAAREANATSIAVGWGHQSMDMLIHGKPDAIVHSPDELMEVLGGGN